MRSGRRRQGREGADEKACYVEKVDASYSNASGEFSIFRKITGPNEIGERLDEGIEILKCMMTGISNLTIVTKSGFDGLNSKMDSFNVKMDGLNCRMDDMNCKMDGANCRMDMMLDKQDETCGISEHRYFAPT